MADNDIKHLDQDYLLTRFNRVLNNVKSLINSSGPIYSVWIRFQLGKLEPIYFDSTSTEKEKNLIASLHMNKGSDGVANDFTLTVQYDPFNYGQETKGQLEKLDEYIAKAMQPDWNASTDEFRGYIQYGYNSPNNQDMILATPKYEFLLTNAKSDVKFDSGLGTYTFEGTSYIAADCDFQTNFSAIPEPGWNPLDIVLWILYYYYGDSTNKPISIKATAETSKTALGYAIDCPADLYADMDSSLNITVPAQYNMSPWQYCLKILQENPLTASEKADPKYANLADLTPDERPRYYMWISDVNGVNTIHISHSRPADSTANTLKIDTIFTWALHDDNTSNIVTGWHPEADLRQYLINKLSYERAKERIEKSGKSVEAIKNDDETAQQYKDDLERTKTGILEMYNASLELVGIPSDPPITAEVRIIPRVLESVSRTKGVYIIQGCEDDISTNGVYKTTLNLFRIRDLD